MSKIEFAGPVPAGEGHPSLQDRQDNAVVTVDGTASFPAWVDDRERWNGWLVPRFTRETAERVLVWLNAVHTEVGDEGPRRPVPRGRLLVDLGVRGGQLVSEQTIPAVPGVPAAGHIVLRSGAWHPGLAESCARCQR